MDEDTDQNGDRVRRPGAKRIDVERLLSQSGMAPEPPRAVRRLIVDAYVVAISAIVVACAVLTLTAVLHFFGQSPLGSYAVELVIIVVCGTFALSSFLLAR